MVKENNHHNIPGSRDGSNNLYNLSWVKKPRHDRYHYLFQNRTPCEVARRILIDGSFFNGQKSIHPSVITDVLDTIPPDGWDQTYNKSAMHSLSSMNLFIYDELHGVVEALGKLQRKQRAKTTVFLNRALKFCNITDSPLDTVRKIFEERYKRQELSWVKAVDEHVRLDIIRGMTSAKVISMQTDVREQMIDVLEGHRENLRRLVHLQ
jgi:hypothetical protein